MSRRSNLRARTRYSVGAILLVLVAGLGVLVWQVIESTASRRAIVLESNAALAQMATTVAAAEVTQRLQTVKGVAERPDVMRLAVAGDWGRFNAFLQGLRGLDPRIVSTAVFDGTGKLMALDPLDPSALGKDFSSRDYFRGALASKGPYVSEAFRQKAEPRVVVVAFANAIRDSSGTVLGVLASTLPISEFDLLSKQVDIPNSGSLQIFDQSGQALSGRPDRELKTHKGHAVIADALAGKTGMREATLPGSRESRLVAFAPVPDIGWAILVEQPISKAFQTITDLTSRLSAVAGLIALVVLIASLVLYRLIGALDAERTRTEAILDSAAEAVATTDADGLVVAVNPAMERLSGWSDEEVIGKPYVDAFPLFDARGEQIPSDERLLTRAMATREVVATHAFELMLLTKDGRRVPVAITAAPILGDEGRVLGGVDVIRDVSLEKEVDQMKSALVSTVSHELRTPLTMIQGFSELLLTRDFDPSKSKDALQQINVSAERLARLIDDLLSVSRIESGRLVVRSVPVDLGEAINQVANPFSVQRDLRIDIEPSIPHVLADRDMLIQVLTNLIGNAVKYSSPDSPITVKAGHSGQSVEVSVADEGIGLTDEEIAQLFEKFYRVDRPEVQEAGGTGLGLFITKSLVEILGGQIWVTSPERVGSTFAFSLPTAPDTTKEVDP